MNKTIKPRNFKTPRTPSARAKSPADPAKSSSASHAPKRSIMDYAGIFQPKPKPKRAPTIREIRLFVERAIAEDVVARGRKN